VEVRKTTKRRWFNGSLLLFIYAVCVYGGFLTPNDHSGPQGGARGVVIGVPLVVLIIAVLTVFYTRKYGGDWKKVRKNLKHNFLETLSFSWKDDK
jgi:hypothetical protein